MTGKIAILGALLLLSPAGTAFAQSNDSEACNSMLETAIGQGLRSQGIDTANACNLSLNQLVQIKTLLEQDGMGSRNQIELILSRAGE